MVIHAPAKINFGLSIGKKQADGYHPVSSILLPVSLYDILTVKLNDSSTVDFTCSDPALPAGGGNLCWKAAALFFKETGTDAGAVIHLEKHIPSGAGLGGGSSDAAAALMALNRLVFGTLTDERIAALAAEIGADVPFFLYRRTCAAAGIGNLLKPAAFPWKPAVLLVAPDFRINTAGAYAAFDKSGGTQKMVDYARILRNLGAIAEARNAVKNDFEPVLFPQYPGMAAIKESLYKCGAAYASMTGSGSVIYGMFDSTSSAQAARNAFSRSCRTFIVSIIENMAQNDLIIGDSNRQ